MSSSVLVDPDSLTPCLLVASPGLSCPFFHHTVVLLVEHSAEGSLGFIVNRPDDVPVADLFESLGLDATRVGTGEVWTGGPVAPETGWVLFDRDSFDPTDVAFDRLEVGRRLGLSARREVLERLAAGEGPDRFAVVLGYAGWGPGQLDEEIAEGSWILTDVDEGLVLDAPAESRWEAALATLGIEAGRVVSFAVAEA